MGNCSSPALSRAPPTSGRLAYRRGVPGDELCVSVLATQVFLDTYATNGINPDLAREALGVYSVDVFAARLREPAVEIVVAESSGHVVGFIDMALQSACPEPEIQGMEILRLYVQAPFQRRGIGQALLKIAEQSALARRDRHVWLTAWVGNLGALAFYPMVGYVDVGATQYLIECQAYENRIFAKPLLTRAA